MNKLDDTQKSMNTLVAALMADTPGVFTGGVSYRFLDEEGCFTILANLRLTPCPTGNHRDKVERAFSRQLTAAFPRAQMITIGFFGLHSDYEVVIGFGSCLTRERVKNIRDEVISNQPRALLSMPVAYAQQEPPAESNESYEAMEALQATRRAL